MYQAYILQLKITYEVRNKKFYTIHQTINLFRFLILSVTSSTLKVEYFEFK